MSAQQISSNADTLHAEILRCSSQFIEVSEQLKSVRMNEVCVTSNARVTLVLRKNQPRACLASDVPPHSADDLYAPPALTLRRVPVPNQYRNFDPP